MSQPNISVADRLAERLKTSDLGSLLGEDDVLALAQEAIRKAFFEPAKRADNYGRALESEAPIVTMAREAFKPHLETMVQGAVAKMVDTPELRAALADAVAASLPAILLQGAVQFVEQGMMNASAVSIEGLKQRLTRDY